MNKTILFFTLALLFAAPALAQPPPPTNGGGGGDTDRLTVNSIDALIATDCVTAGCLTTVLANSPQTGPSFRILNNPGTVFLQYETNFGNSGLLEIGNGSEPRNSRTEFIINALAPTMQFAGASGSTQELIFGDTFDDDAGLLRYIHGGTSSTECFDFSVNGSVTRRFQICQDFNESKGLKDFGPLSSAPTAITAGDTYFDTDLALECTWNGSAWKPTEDSTAATCT